MGRDKEFSAYASHTLGIAGSYEFSLDFAKWVRKGTLNLHYDRMMIDYKDFRDLRQASEPLYSLDADVIQFFVSFWF